ncbi:MAG: S1 RNA-binding domain-containing protein, partial [Oscillospiraceae bacterium]|nr:S1 RNA-binding domain-containing protein [Oscillospiraceae bacterium]
VVNVGDVVTVKITAIDTEKKRISLSMRAVNDDSAAEDEAEEADEVVYSDEAPAADAPAEDAAE